MVYVDAALANPNSGRRVYSAGDNTSSLFLFSHLLSPSGSRLGRFASPFFIVVNLLKIVGDVQRRQLPASYGETARP